jgi:hypothetical protein
MYARRIRFSSQGEHQRDKMGRTLKLLRRGITFCINQSGMDQDTGLSDAADYMPESVVQRRDGSDAEKAAVNVVLQKMREYLIHEVYPIEDYKQNLPRW